MEGKAMAALANYLTEHGGENDMLSGWSARVAVRDPAGKSAKVNDVYFFNARGAKFRSKIEVARHLGLMQTPDRAQYFGHLAAEGTDHKLWKGAYAAGWRVHSTHDSHNTYRAPDGTRFKRKDDAMEWHPPKRVKLKLASATTTSPPPLATFIPLTATEGHADSSAYEGALFDLNSSDDDGSSDDEEEAVVDVVVEEKEAEVNVEDVKDVEDVNESRAEVATDVTGRGPSGPWPLVRNSVPPVGPAISGMSMLAMRTILESLRLGQYAGAFYDLGFDDPDWLSTLDQAQLLDVASNAGMKPGHAMKFAGLFPRSATA